MTSFREMYDYIQAGHERPDMSVLYAKGYGLYCDSVRDNRPVMVHQEQARANDCELINIFHDGGMRKFGLFAFENEEDDICAEMEQCRYVYSGIELLSIKGRLFAYCMVFEQQTGS